jgi:hypothetical protein
MGKRTRRNRTLRRFLLSICFILRESWFKVLLPVDRTAPDLRKAAQAGLTRPEKRLTSARDSVMIDVGIVTIRKAKVGRI